VLRLGVPKASSTLSVELFARTIPAHTLGDVDELENTWSDFSLVPFEGDEIEDRESYTRDEFFCDNILGNLQVGGTYGFSAKLSSWTGASGLAST
jgi:hypothetical protein